MVLVLHARGRLLPAGSCNLTGLHNLNVVTVAIHAVEHALLVIRVRVAAGDADGGGVAR
jgi:hypothetical protein